LSHADQLQTRSAITTFRPNQAPIRQLLEILFVLIGIIHALSRQHFVCVLLGIHEWWMRRHDHPYTKLHD